MIYIFSFILSSFLFHFPTRSMNFFKNQKTIKMSFKDVMLKGFSLSNCTTKAKCWVVKALRSSGHHSTKGRIRMNMGTQKDSREPKQRQFPYVGGLQKIWHSHLSRAYPEALKNTNTHTTKHTTQPNRATQAADRDRSRNSAACHSWSPLSAFPAPGSLQQALRMHNLKTERIILGWGLSSLLRFL